jgi:glycosyltransferase involved in cell wall biosynthesis
VADVFVMCSGIGETWGLSTNEAMNFRLPLILSNTSGSSIDLVQNGKNGFVFKEGNYAELAHCIDIVFSESFDTIKAGEISYNLISNFSISAICYNIQKELKNQN